MADIALGSVAIFAPVFNLCERLYNGHRITMSMGQDLGRMGIQLEAQHIRLEQVS